jgi:hypothetical protein
MDHATGDFSSPSSSTTSSLFPRPKPVFSNSAPNNNNSNTTKPKTNNNTTTATTSSSKSPSKQQNNNNNSNKKMTSPPPPSSSTTTASTSSPMTTTVVFAATQPPLPTNNTTATATSSNKPPVSNGNSPSNKPVISSKSSNNATTTNSSPSKSTNDTTKRTPKQSSSSTNTTTTSSSSTNNTKNNTKPSTNTTENNTTASLGQGSFDAPQSSPSVHHQPHPQYTAPVSGRSTWLQHDFVDAIEKTNRRLSETPKPFNALNADGTPETTVATITKPSPRQTPGRTITTSTGNTTTTTTGSTISSQTRTNRTPQQLSSKSYGGTAQQGTPMPDVGVSPATRDSLRELETQRDSLEDQGRYLEAEAVHQRLVELKINEETRRRDTARAENMMRLLGVDEKHLTDVQEFNGKWDDKIREFERESDTLMRQLKEKHETTLQALRVEIEKFLLRESLERTFPPSKTLIELRRAEKALARQREYKQANSVKVTADELEEQEHIERQTRGREHVLLKEERLKEKHRQELTVLNQKIASTRSVLQEQRKQEFALLLQRYQNMKADIESNNFRVEQGAEKRIERISPQKTPGGGNSGNKRL